MTTPNIHRVTERARRVAISATAWITARTQILHARLFDRDDTGEVTEKAALTAIFLALALGLGAIVKAAIDRYASQIH
jgi:hypothetical protein